MKRWVPVTTALLLSMACGPAEAPPDAEDTVPVAGFEPPVLTNPDVPVRYPPEAYADRVEGTVILRLYVDEGGILLADSTRVAEGSGVASLDSAALAAVAAMRFAPARRDGSPVATAFLQPVHFRHPESGSAGGGD